MGMYSPRILSFILFLLSSSFTLSYARKEASSSTSSLSSSFSASSSFSSSSSFTDGDGERNTKERTRNGDLSFIFLPVRNNEHVNLPNLSGQRYRDLEKDRPRYRYSSRYGDGGIHRGRENSMSSINIFSVSTPSASASTSSSNGKNIKLNFYSSLLKRYRDRQQARQKDQNENRERKRNRTRGRRRSKNNDDINIERERESDRVSIPATDLDIVHIATSSKSRRGRLSDRLSALKKSIRIRFRRDGVTDRRERRHKQKQRWKKEKNEKDEKGQRQMQTQSKPQQEKLNPIERGSTWTKPTPIPTTANDNIVNQTTRKSVISTATDLAEQPQTEPQDLSEVEIASNYSQDQYLEVTKTKTTTNNTSCSSDFDSDTDSKLELESNNHADKHNSNIKMEAANNKYLQSETRSTEREIYLSMEKNQNQNETLESSSSRALSSSSLSSSSSSSSFPLPSSSSSMAATRERTVMSTTSKVSNISPTSLLQSEKSRRFSRFSGVQKRLRLRRQKKQFAKAAAKERRSLSVSLELEKRNSLEEKREQLSPIGQHQQQKQQEKDQEQPAVADAVVAERKKSPPSISTSSSPSSALSLRSYRNNPDQGGGYLRRVNSRKIRKNKGANKYKLKKISTKDIVTGEIQEGNKNSPIAINCPGVFRDLVLQYEHQNVLPLISVQGKGLEAVSLLSSMSASFLEQKRRNINNNDKRDIPSSNPGATAMGTTAMETTVGMAAAAKTSPTTPTTTTGRGIGRGGEMTTALSSNDININNISSTIETEKEAESDNGTFSSFLSSSSSFSSACDTLAPPSPSSSPPLTKKNFQKKEKKEETGDNHVEKQKDKNENENENNHIVNLARDEKNNDKNNKENKDNVYASHPVVEVIHERYRLRSKPKERKDNFKVGLAIEGGGMRGSVSAGAAAAIDMLGLCDSFDTVYGSSAGALIAAYFVSRELNGTRIYSDILPDAGKNFLDRSKLLEALFPVAPLKNYQKGASHSYQGEPLDFASSSSSSSTATSTTLTGEQMNKHIENGINQNIKKKSTKKGNNEKSQKNHLNQKRKDTQEQIQQQQKDQQRKLKSKSTRGAVLNLDFLLDEVLQEISPFNWDKFWELNKVQPIRIVASGLTSMSSYSLNSEDGHFHDMSTFLQCLRASMCVPGVAGPLVSDISHVEEPLADALVVEPIPYRSAVKEGCTHVLILRTRPNGNEILGKKVTGFYEKWIAKRFFEKGGLTKPASHMKDLNHLKIYAEDILHLNFKSHDLYHHAHEDNLYFGDAVNISQASLLSVAPPASCQEIDTLETSKVELIRGIREGFSAAWNMLAPPEVLKEYSGEEMGLRIFPDSPSVIVDGSSMLKEEKEKRQMQQQGEEKVSPYFNSATSTASTTAATSSTTRTNTTSNLVLTATKAKQKKSQKNS